MEARKPIVCGLSARGIIPPLPQEDTDDDVADITPTEVEMVEISDEEEEDMVELSFEEYRRNMGYLIRVEESVEDIEPEFRRMLKRMEQEEKKLREEKFKVLNSGIKLEVGQSSKGDGKKRKVTDRLLYVILFSTLVKKNPVRKYYITLVFARVYVTRVWAVVNKTNSSLLHCPEWSVEMVYAARFKCVRGALKGKTVLLVTHQLVEAGPASAAASNVAMVSPRIQRSISIESSLEQVSFQVYKLYSTKAYVWRGMILVLFFCGLARHEIARIASSMIPNKSKT
ncbi:hypothetical protein YC2023_114687 [Brassica napus]